MSKTKFALSAEDGIFKLKFDEDGKIVSATPVSTDANYKIPAHKFANRTVQAFDMTGGTLYKLKFGKDGVEGVPELSQKPVAEGRTAKAVDIETGTYFSIHYNPDGSLRFATPDQPMNELIGMGGEDFDFGKRSQLGMEDYIGRKFKALDVAGGAYYEIEYGLAGLRGFPTVTKKAIRADHDFEVPGFIRITPKLMSEKEAKDALASARKEIDRMIGLTDAKTQMEEVLSNFKATRVRKKLGMKTPPPSLHLAFLGNPGTGKTTYARYYASLLRAAGILEHGHVVEVDRSKLVAGYVGQTEMLTRAVLEAARGGVLIIDEFYALGAKGSGGGSSEAEFGQRALEVILKFMEDERADLVVILTGYTQEMMAAIESNPGVKRRLAKIMDFPDYNAKELSQIFNLFAKDMGMSFTPQARKHIDEIIEHGVQNKDRHFGNAGQIRNLIEAVQMRMDARIDRLGLWDAAEKELDATGNVSKSLRGKLTRVTLEDVQGLSIVGKKSDEFDGPKQVIGFGTRFTEDKKATPTPTRPANDETTARASVSAKRSATARGFNVK